MTSVLYVYGLNHKAAPIELREKISFTDELCRTSLPELKDIPGVNGALILSTCNRVELIVESELDPPSLKRGLAEFLSKTHRLKEESVLDYFYLKTGAEAVSHVLRVASSLDSMIPGETQIVGQLRRAYSLTVETGTAGSSLHKLLHHAFFTAKRVRVETEIGKSRPSVASAAVELGKRIFYSLNDKTALIIGAGKMAEIAAKELLKAETGRIMIASRSQSAGKRFSNQTGAEFIPWGLLEETLIKADLTICSTSAPHFLITKPMIKNAFGRQDKLRVLLDISLPRNIEPLDAPIKSLFLYDLDDLQPRLAEQLLKLNLALDQAMEIVTEEVKKFQRVQEAMNVGKSIGSIREKMQQRARRELKKSRLRLGNLSASQEMAIEQLIITVVNQIFHPFFYGLRKFPEQDQISALIRTLDGILSE